MNLVVLCIALWHPRIDVEPAAFVLRGYSVHLGVEPPAAPGWIFSAGAYGFDVPQLLTPDDWDARVFGAGVFADRRIHRDWIVGGQVGAQWYDASRAGVAARSRHLLILARAGYEWHPRGIRFYFFPWAGAAWTPRVSGDYDAGSVQPYAAVDLGWRF